METKLIPTVGRMVHFNTRGSNDGVFPPRLLAAIITKVYDDETISVCAFREHGFNNELKITRGDNPGQWNWMPYQLGQQKKTEEILNKFDTEKE